MTKERAEGPYTLVQPASSQAESIQSTTQASATPARRTALDSILRFLGFVLLGTALLLGALALGSGWLLRDTTQTLFSRSTETTVINGQAIVASITQSNKQILVEHYNTVDIDYSEAPAGWLRLLPIRQKFVLLLKGRVPAGFDLESLSADDIWISADGQRVQLVLPPPVIFTENIALDLENSRILGESDSCPDLICQDQLSTLQEQLLPQGRRLLAEASMRSGILDQVARDGERYYEQFLRALGFSEVRVVISAEGLAED